MMKDKNIYCPMCGKTDNDYLFERSFTDFRCISCKTEFKIIDVGSEYIKHFGEELLK